MVFVGRGFSRDVQGPANKGFSPWSAISSWAWPFMRWLHICAAGCAPI